MLILLFSIKWLLWQSLHFQKWGRVKSETKAPDAEINLGYEHDSRISNKIMVNESVMCHRRWCIDCMLRSCWCNDATDALILLMHYWCYKFSIRISSRTFLKQFALVWMPRLGAHIIVTLHFHYATSRGARGLQSVSCYHNLWQKKGCLKQSLSSMWTYGAHCPQLIIIPICHSAFE